MDDVLKVNHPFIEKKETWSSENTNKLILPR